MKHKYSKRKLPASSSTMEISKRDEIITRLEEKIAILDRKVSTMWQIIKADFRSDQYHESVIQHLISEFGLDVPERLRPRR